MKLKILFPIALILGLVKAQEPEEPECKGTFHNEVNALFYECKSNGNVERHELFFVRPLVSECVQESLS